MDRYRLQKVLLPSIIAWDMDLDLPKNCHTNDGLTNSSPRKDLIRSLLSIYIDLMEGVLKSYGRGIMLEFIALLTVLK